jgi:hypothetical protein
VLIRARWCFDRDEPSTLVVLLLTWGALSLLWRLLRWSLRALGVAVRSVAVASVRQWTDRIAEGRYPQVERDPPWRKQPGLRAPALLSLHCAAQCAVRRRAWRASALDEADAEAAALVLRAICRARAFLAERLALLGP